jgi:hypothetical protein
MAKRAALVLSSVLASTLVTAAAAPASAQTFLDYAIDIALGVTPADNNWASPCDIDWAPDPYKATTNGVCYFTLSLKKSDPTITNPILTQWWGSTNPPSPDLHELIVENDPAVNHFEHVADFSAALAGDLLVTEYQQGSGNWTGYTMMLGLDPEWHSTTMEGYDRYLCTVLDSTRTPHGNTDTRWLADAGGVHDWGVGIGEMYVDTDPMNGAIVRHTWSRDPKGTSYPQAVRNMAAGRFIR